MNYIPKYNDADIFVCRKTYNIFTIFEIKAIANNIVEYKFKDLNGLIWSDDAEIFDNCQDFILIDGPTYKPTATMSGPFTPVLPPKTPKHKIGDVVLIYNKRAKITQVTEQKYSPTDDYVFFMYDVEWLEEVPISTTRFNENSINPWGAPELEPVKAKNPCECGASAVHWASEHHASWCPMYRRDTRSE